MRARIVAVLVATLATFVGTAIAPPASAGAQDWNPTTQRMDAPVQYPAPAIVTRMVTLATKWFPTQGQALRPCPNGIEEWYVPQDYLTARGAGATGYHSADDQQCAIWIGDGTVQTLWYGGYEPGLADACMMVFHEVGHALGLPHSRSGVMAGEDHDPEPYPGAWTPSPCTAWAVVAAKQTQNSALDRENAQTHTRIVKDKPKRKARKTKARRHR